MTVPVRQYNCKSFFLDNLGEKQMLREELVRETGADQIRSHEWYPPCKAALEVVLAAILLLLVSPLILFLLVLVSITSEGSPLYVQERVGLGGRRYKIFKIRSMTYDCERKSGPRWSTVGDPRVTPLGRWLRKTHLDELPQLWNVLRGDMSLVGPRPERPEFVQKLEMVIPDYHARLQVRPGITGLAQVQLPPDEDLAGVRRKVECDALYVSSMAPGLDARILIATVFKIVGISSEKTRQWLCLPHHTSSPPLEIAGLEFQGSMTQMQTA